MTEPQDTRAESRELISQATDEFRERQKRLAEREAIQSAATPARHRMSLIALILALPALIAILVLSFTDLSLTSLIEPRLTESEARHQAQKTLDDLVLEVEAFRHDFSELPEGLIDVGIPSRGGWTYMVIGKA